MRQYINTLHGSNEESDDMMQHAKVICGVLMFGCLLLLTSSCFNREYNRKKEIMRRAAQSLKDERQYRKDSVLLAALNKVTPASLEQERLVSVFVHEKRQVLIAYWLGTEPVSSALRLRDITGKFEQTYEIADYYHRENAMAAEHGIIFSAGWSIDVGDIDEAKWEELCDALRNGEVIAELLFPPKQHGLTPETSDAFTVEFFPMRQAPPDALGM